MVHKMISKGLTSARSKVKEKEVVLSVMVNPKVLTISGSIAISVYVSKEEVKVEDKLVEEEAPTDEANLLLEDKVDPR